MSQVGVHGTLRDRYGLGTESTPVVIIIVIAIGLMTDGDLRPAFTAVIIISISVAVSIAVVLVVVVVLIIVVTTPEIARVIVAGECGHTETRYQAGRDHQLRYTES